MAPFLTAVCAQGPPLRPTNAFSFLYILLLPSTTYSTQSVVPFLFHKSSYNHSQTDKLTGKYRVLDKNMR